MFPAISNDRNVALSSCPRRDGSMSSTTLCQPDVNLKVRGMSVRSFAQVPRAGSSEGLRLPDDQMRRSLTRDSLRHIVAELGEVQPLEERLAAPEEHRGLAEVRFVDQLRLEVLPNSRL